MIQEKTITIDDSGDLTIRLCKAEDGHSFTGETGITINGGILAAMNVEQYARWRVRRVGEGHG